MKTAHPAYANGLRETGISVERIPRIDEMDERLGEYGWGAVAVDGFIPPRAFQEFQALFQIGRGLDGKVHGLTRILKRQLDQTAIAAVIVYDQNIYQLPAHYTWPTGTLLQMVNQ